ncbi:MAG TPA: helix-turn-helix transcriptional regulator [Solirubrobacteraceae bacterium]|nr:helix-turn-helix transcriptional regulator [Solirubrobacteraceae bacterium]
MSVNANERARLGARLRHAREAGGLSLEEVAQRSGVIKSLLSRVERDITSPSIASLVGIRDAGGRASRPLPRRILR